MKPRGRRMPAAVLSVANAAGETKPVLRAIAGLDPLGEPGAPETEMIVVDDDASIRAIACLILEEEPSIRARAFSSPSDALVAMKRSVPRLAIVDFDIEHRQGIDLAEAICADESLDEMALIGVSFDVQRVQLELVDLAVQKPYVTPSLLAIARAAIARAKEGGP